MTVANGIFLPAGLENNPSLELSSEQLSCQEQDVETGSGKPICERPAFWCLSLICAIPVELSELEIKGGIDLLKVCL